MIPPPTTTTAARSRTGVAVSRGGPRWPGRRPVHLDGGPASRQCLLDDAPLDRPGLETGEVAHGREQVHRATLPDLHPRPDARPGDEHGDPLLVLGAMRPEAV